ncbi:MAG: 2,3-diphosphoglycerate-dependent phosphoglycerate mutase [Elusimicrobia bacterium]|jgi:2,3-bisphosphoglycerate-dependent phosphoglycerate mutase|nr:2,3-diphosphoglycerate-dependent phosphoglycerate mutase [Elusimicrobiota bacterium]MBK7545917.1 2,3-diphosphoglycerate-dependent phosphoglycerate mutase [Elusimicrobiota bacterium]MBK7574793.1 2,3-diphosphoglycerate-dependent phosphoglycerate mutase [Elusimicrobiota bacterium]MBK7687555.1 2,3-diphosphoglycerate-dependent phosphoglycerate mutase [Elusimicrobiota bacterium]MBK8125527.1 2,3-diphosphoglycerate-dependent phosphoglycerate mutase [Elusimicrobiota bacterium]
MGTLILVRHGQSQWNLENRFTGWVDVPLTPQGESEARRAGEHLKGYQFTRAFASVLQRAQRTLGLILEVTQQKNVPVIKDKALNERHYGALQGLDKKETARKYGDEQVKIWRRSYDVPPPTDKTDMNPEGIAESLKDTAARTLPYFYSDILPHVKKGETVLVAAHGNSLRSIVMDLDKLTKEQVLELNLDTGVPIVYEIDDRGHVVSKKILN